MTHVLDLFKRSWKSYKYRFLPWLAFNLPQQVKNQSAEFLKADEAYIKELFELFQVFTKPKLELLFRDNAKRWNHFSELNKVNNNVLLEQFGFKVGVQTSNISGMNGLGVFVTEGYIRQGQLVALYPGAIYEPFQPILFQSIRNQYILRCADGINIDGNNRGLSRMVYKSLYGRERWGHTPICDVSWLDRRFRPVNPLNIGQIVNNGDQTLYPSNVMYHELNIHPEEVDPRLRIFLPNIHYESTCGVRAKQIRLVPLIATKEINVGDELYSSYFSTVSSR
ncbi:SET domain-containing protein 9-like [Tigriopus californicus]|uniref:SET domain-containing protein 9-like n=1 Tax=Tigriopus californicus TaxID=6832 RepID=UPI0027DAAD19|nr:SET domain-containing protein 9-like [Tigriopus californicus]